MKEMFALFLSLLSTALTKGQVFFFVLKHHQPQLMMHKQMLCNKVTAANNFFEVLREGLVVLSLP